MPRGERGEKKNPYQTDDLGLSMYTWGARAQELGPSAALVSSLSGALPTSRASGVRVLFRIYICLCVCVYLARARLREEEVSIREFEEPVASALRTCVVKAPAAAAGFHGEPAKASAPHRQGLRRPQQSRHQQEPLIPKLSKVTCYLFFSLRFRFSTGEHGLPEAPAAR